MISAVGRLGYVLVSERTPPFYLEMPVVAARVSTAAWGSPNLKPAFADGRAEPCTL